MKSNRSNQGDNVKKIFVLPLLLIALALPACAPLTKFADTITQTIVNPLGPVDIYRVKNVYAAGLTLAAEYRNYCWSRTYASLMADPVARPLCQNRRPNVRTIQFASGEASKAIRIADNFIRQNPSGNAVTYVTAAWDAVQAFRSTIPAVK